MANRYWVGGAGTWDTTTTTNWSATSGGAGGASVPTSADNVIFDTASGTGAIVCTAGVCLDLTVTATQALTLGSGAGSYSCYGSLSCVSGGSFSFDVQSGCTFRATTTGKTITYNGHSYGGIMAFNGVGGGWTLGSALSTTSTNSSITFTNGTFDTSSSGNYSISKHTSLALGAGTKTINFNASSITFDQYTSNMNWSANTTGLTFNCGTSTINLATSTTTSGSVGTVDGGNQTFYNINWADNKSVDTITMGNFTCNNFNINSSTTAGSKIVFISAAINVTGTFTPGTGGTATNRNNIRSSVLGTTRIITCASVAATSDVDFRDITIAGAAAPMSGTRLGDCGGNSRITFPAAKTVYWNLAAGGNWSATAWATSGGGTPAVANFPLSQDTAIFQSTGLNTATTVTFDAAYALGSIDMSARTTNTMTLATGATAVVPAVYGSWTGGTGVTYSGTGALVFAGRGNTQTITSAGKTFTEAFTIYNIGGTVVLADALTTNLAISHEAGILDFNGFNWTGTTYTSTATAIAKNITFNGGTLTCSATSTTAFNQLNTATYFSTTAGTGTGSINLTNAAAKTFVGASLTYNCTLNQGGSGVLTITGSNTFSNIISTYTATGATTISFTNANTTTVSAFTATGTTGNLLTLNNVTAGGTTAVIALTGGGSVATPDYLIVKDLSFTPFATDGTAPYNWYAGANSTNSGNNKGILFAASTLIAYLITSGTSWTVPANWNVASNTLHLIGGGGGGGGARYTTATNKAGGAGGGGGGYLTLTNQNLSGVITYAIGAAGTAGGSGGGTGGTGGTTTFNSQSATGGGGGSTTTTPTSVGGSGGTGTYSGGVGGSGVSTTVSGIFLAGGGGGGAAGPNGVGGTGGIGFGSLTGSQAAGGGGGGNGGGANGGTGSASTGGTGGNNSLGTGGGASNTAGTLGGGGGGGVGAVGTTGGVGIDISKTIGGGGGASGAANQFAGGNGSIYGAGGGGGGAGAVNATVAGGTGGQGMIFIIYSQSSVTFNSNFFAFF